LLRSGLMVDANDLRDHAGRIGSHTVFRVDQRHRQIDEAADSHG
jgi:hypothetical protein